MQNISRYVTESDLAERRARDVRAPEIAAIIRKVVEQGKGRTAAKVRTLLHAAYARAISAELSPTASGRSIDSSIQLNPVAAIPSMSEFSRARHRVLTKSELKEFWRRASIDGNHKDEPFALRAVRLVMLLGGQRFQQLRRVRIADVDIDANTVLLMDPKGMRKRPRAHLLPLCPVAKAEVEWLMSRSRDSGSVYLLAGASKRSGIAPNTVSRFVKEISTDMMKNGQSSSRFQFSDLRRTIETTLASMGVHKDVRAQLQSHGISGVQSTHYDMYDYMREKRDALVAWEQFLEALR